MARGQQSKLIIQNKILNMFENSFLYNEGKEIRIPIVEDGETIQIKVALTAAKTNVQSGDDTALPGAAVVSETNFTSTNNKEEVVVTEEEKQNVQELLKKLGL